MPLDALGNLTAGDRQDSADTVDGSAQRGGIGEPDYQMVTPPSARSAIQVTVRRQAAVDADRAAPLADDGRAQPYPSRTDYLNLHRR